MGKNPIPPQEMDQTQSSLHALHNSINAMASAQAQFQKTVLEEIRQLRVGFEQLQSNLSFPVFHGGYEEGDNPIDWLCLAERHFKYLNTPEEKKVQIASLHLRGDAIPWMQGLYEPYHSFDSWSEFVVEFLKFFGPGGYVDIEVALGELKQTGTVKEYTTEFNRLYAALDMARFHENKLQALNNFKERR